MKTLKAVLAAGFVIVLLVVLIPVPGHSRALLSVAANADDAVALYKAKCAVCHAADGSGNTTMGKQLSVKDLSSPEVQKQSDAQLTNIISKGKQKMPSFGKSLSADQIKQLVAHIRSLKK